MGVEDRHATDIKIAFVPNLRSYFFIDEQVGVNGG